MAFKQGTPIRPVAMDFSAIARGGEAYGAGVGQGLAALGQGIGRGMEQRKQYKDAISAAKPWLDAVKTMDGVLPPGMLQQIDSMGEAIKDEELPLSQRGAMAQQLAGMGQSLFGAGMQMQMAQMQPRGPQPMRVPQESLEVFQQTMRDKGMDYTITGIDPETGDALVSGVSPFGGPSTVVNMPGAEKKPTAFQTTLDQNAAKLYSNWMMEGGRERAQQSVEIFSGIADLLDEGKIDTRGIIDYLPAADDTIRALFNPTGQDAIDRIRGVAYQTLRETLGAQFTEREGQRLVESYFNPKLGEEANAERLKAYVRVNKKIIEAKDRATQYLDENETIIGFKGNYNWTVKDVEKALDFDPEQDSAPKNPQKLIFDPESGKLIPQA